MANNSNSNSGSKKGPRAPRTKDGNKKPGKKKVSVLVQEKVEYVDYKDVNLLQRFMSDRSKIRSRRVSGNSTQQQREVATAVKNAREMALLPYAKRVATTRTSRPPRGLRRWRSAWAGTPAAGGSGSRRRRCRCRRRVIEEAGE